MPLFKGKTVFRNHELEIGNHVGVIGEASWQDITETADGKAVIPAGVNAPFIVDSVLYRKEAREMLSQYSPLKSVSISVEFEWEASHDFTDPSVFNDFVGRILDGREVTRVVTKIISILESSLVWDGADKYAKKLDENGLVKLEKAEKNKESTEAVIIENKNNDMATEKEQISMTKEEFDRKENAWKGSFDALKAELESAKTENANLSGVLEAQKAYVEYGKAAHLERVAEAKRLFTANGKTLSAAMAKDIEASSYEVLAEKIELLGGKLESSFTRTCTKCGCTDISLKSSVKSDLEGEKPAENNKVNLGF